MKVLIVSYYFPPLGGIASIRILKYVKYLRDFGVEPIVVCADPSFVKAPKDYSLSGEIPSGIEVYRSKYFDMSWVFKVLYGIKMNALVSYLRNTVLIPDIEVIWSNRARRAIDRALAKHPEINLCMISAGPFSSLFLGKYVKQKYNLKYLCEFRDEWTNNPERLGITYPAKSSAKELIWESKAVSDAHAFVFLSSIMKRNFESRYPAIINRPSVIIPNGFDETDFVTASSNTVPKPTNTLRIVYCGSFYDRRQPDVLWKALKKLVDDGTIDPTEICFDIYGKNAKRFVLGRYHGDPLITDIVHIKPFVSHLRSIELMLQADALLLFIPGGKNTESVLTGKLFDYMRSYRPILAIVPQDGLAAEYLHNSGLGFIADPDDQSKISECILKLYRFWKEGSLDALVPNKEYIGQYQRRHLCANLASLLKGLGDK